MSCKWMVSLLAVVGLSAGCNNKETGSAPGSLDNFARSSEATLHDNMCVGSYDLIDDLFSADVDVINIHVADDKARTIIQSRVESALRAVPTEIQVAYFGLGGIIEVTPQTHAICSQNLDEQQKIRMAEGGSKIKGCWKHQTDYLESANGEITEDQRVVMYIDTDVGSIEHALVRTFGYVLSQVLVKLDHDVANGKLINGANDEHFTAAKEQITLAFLKDVANSNGKYNLDRFKDMIGSDVINTDALARRSGWDLLVKNKPKAAQSFMDYVFAEAFDSQYCGTGTREIMNQDFPETAEAFYPVSNAINALSSDLKEIDTVEELAKIETTEPSKLPATSDSEKKENDLNLPTGITYGLSGMALTHEGYSLFIGRIFRGIGRVIGGVARGIFRGAQAVVMGASRIIAGAARVIGRVAMGVLRVGAAIMRGVGRLAVSFFRGAVRVARGLIIGAGLVLRAGSRLALGVGRAVIRGTGFVIRSLFGSSTAYATEPGMVLEKVKLDQDRDSIEDTKDLCSNTPVGARVHTANPQWLGCAGGQYRDRDLGYRMN